MQRILSMSNPAMAYYKCNWNYCTLQDLFQICASCDTANAIMHIILLPLLFTHSGMIPLKGITKEPFSSSILVASQASRLVHAVRACCGY